ncbi:GTP-binding protein [archaeon]|nr:GTP-binding protein [archaeon]
MSSVDEKIQEVLDEIAKTPSNKATQGHLGKLKTKLSKLQEQKDLEKSKKSGTSDHGYSVKKTGDASCVFVGFPSVGKSTLLNKITNAESRVGAYAFTTLTVVPGVLDYGGAKIQVLDIPGIIEDAASGKGRGREILSVARIADTVIIMTDVKRPECIDTLKKELYKIGLRLNQNPPDVTIKKKDRGGIMIRSTAKQELTQETMKGIFNEMGVINADVILREKLSIERLIDAISKNRLYVPMIVLLNKIDTISKEELSVITSKIKDPFIAISAEMNENLDKFKQELFEKMGLLRIYMKQPGKPTDFKEPLIIKKDSTVMDVARKIHKDFAKYLIYSKITGKSAKFDGQKLGGDHILLDKDIVEMFFQK